MELKELTFYSVCNKWGRNFLLGKSILVAFVEICTEWEEKTIDRKSENMENKHNSYLRKQASRRQASQATERCLLRERRKP